MCYYSPPSSCDFCESLIHLLKKIHFAILFDNRIPSDSEAFGTDRLPAFKNLISGILSCEVSKITPKWFVHQTGTFCCMLSYFVFFFTGQEGNPGPPGYFANALSLRYTPKSWYALSTSSSMCTTSNSQDAEIWGGGQGILGLQGEWEVHARQMDLKTWVSWNRCLWSSKKVALFSCNMVCLEMATTRATHCTFSSF